MMQTEVTNAAYAACERAGACTPRSCTSDARTVTLRTTPRAPALCTNLWQAMEFCAWVGGRLPTPVEWEFAAKSSDARIYPWGNAAPDATRANCQCGDSFDGPARVGSFPRGDTAWGLKDLAGNVAERTAARVGTPQSEVRGGSWMSPPVLLRASHRGLVDADWGDAQVGFRCVR